ncbi:hypothetical protein FRC10_010879, partial [Ceratobasidium sp. 414]
MSPNRKNRPGDENLNDLGTSQAAFADSNWTNPVDRNAENASNKSWYAYPRIPGVSTCPQLARFNLGVENTFGIVMCLKCPPNERCVNFATARDHIKTHLPDLSRQITKKMLKDWLSEARVEKRNLYDVPVPKGRIAPLGFIEYVEVRKCTRCEDLKDPIDIYFRSRTGRYNHHTEVHNDHSRPEDYPDRVVWAQTLCPKTHSRKKWFEVDPNFTGLGRSDKEKGDPADPYEESTYEAAEAFTRLWTPVKPLAVDPSELRQVIPFLYYTGWHEHVKGHDLGRLRELVEVDPDTDPLQGAYWAAYKTFVEDQKRIPNIFLPTSWCIMDDESGPPQRPFQKLTKPVAQGYGRLLGRFFVLICRMLLQLQEAERSGTEPWYAIKMTELQRTWAENLLYYAEQREPRKHHIHELAYGTADAFWRKQSPEYFEGIEIDQFSDLTTRFACLICLTETDDFDAPSNCSSKIGHIKYLMRSMLYFGGVQEHLDNFLPAHEILARAQPSLSRRKVTPFANIAYLVAHATNHADSAVAMPNVAWVSPTIVAVGADRIVPESYFEHIVNLTRAFTKNVDDNLLLGIDPVTLEWPWDEDRCPADELGSMDANYSLFTDARNKFYEFERKLGIAFQQHPRGKVLFDKDENGQTMFDAAAVDLYLASFDKANGQLGLLLQLTGGLPGRIAELVSITYENTTWRPRGVRMPCAGQVQFVLSYSKASSQTGMDRHIAHGVPWCIGSRWLLLKGLVGPLAGLMTKFLHGESARSVQVHKVFTRAGKEVKPEQFGDTMEAWATKNMGLRLRPRLHRQLSIALGRRLLPDAMGMMAKGLTVFDAQCGHGGVVARKHYARQANDRDRHWGGSCEDFSVLSSQWHYLIYNKHKDLLTAREIARASEAAQEVAAGETTGPGIVIDEEKLAERIAQRLLANGALVKDIGDRLVQQMLERNHDFRLAATSDDMMGKGRRLEDIRGHRETRAANIGLRAEHASVLKTYCDNTSAAWSCPQQGQALAHCLARQQSLLVVLGTGAGKSLLFAAPQYFEFGITVVVFTLRPVMMQQIEDSIKRDPERPIVKWHSRLAMTTGVVAIQVEAVQSKGFQTWLSGLVANKTLARIVIDEAHVIPSSKTYRAVMSRLRMMPASGVPIVCATATLPPSMEESLRYSIGDPTWGIVRAPTQRKNISLRVGRYETRADAVYALKAIVDRYLAEIGLERAILVIVPSQYEAEAVAAELGCAAYHSGMLTEQKDGAARDWLNGISRVIVGTTAIGTGVHHPGCVLAIHFGRPYGVLGYGQETGRVGRAGCPSMAVMLIHGEHPPLRGPDVIGWAAMMSILDEPECIRWGMSVYLDGADLAVTCFSGYDLCSNCLVFQQRSEGRHGRGLADTEVHYPANQFLRSGTLPSGLISLSPAAPASSGDLSTVPATSPILTALNGSQTMEIDPRGTREGDDSAMDWQLDAAEPENNRLLGTLPDDSDEDEPMDDLISVEQGEDQVNLGPGYEAIGAVHPVVPGYDVPGDSGLQPSQ